MIDQTAIAALIIIYASISIALGRFMVKLSHHTSKDLFKIQMLAFAWPFYGVFLLYVAVTNAISKRRQNHS